MIALNGLAALPEPCPACGGELIAHGWAIPGMRSLADARCVQCHRRFYVDLPIGQAIYSPMILDPETGVVSDRAGVPWFARWLSDSFAVKTSAMPHFAVEHRRRITRPVVLLNCLDVLYGHCLLKLFNAGQYLAADRHDVVVMVQPLLRDLVPDGVAECWVVDLPLREGTSWSDALAERIAQEVGRLGEVHLAPVHSHPHASSFAIEDFSRVRPFDVAGWGSAAPAVTFIWRDDRIWSRSSRSRWRRGAGTTVQQGLAVTTFFAALRSDLPQLDAAVVGVGLPSAFPDWIADLRTTSPNAESDRAWLARYARSHLVIGVHGSNMLLPTAHAGGAIELIGADRAGNFLQDVLFNGDDARDLFFRYRFVGPDIAAEDLATLASQIVRRYPDFHQLMGKETTRDPDAGEQRHVRH